jgi:hypothetical protein
VDDLRQISSKKYFFWEGRRIEINHPHVFEHIGVNLSSAAASRKAVRAGNPPPSSHRETCI